jgi:hypothetical protein
VLVNFKEIRVKLIKIAFLTHKFLVHISINYLTAQSLILLEKLTVAQLLKNYLVFCGTRSFIDVFTRTRQWFLSWAIWTQSTLPHSISQTSILIFSSHQSLGLPSGLFTSWFPTKILCTFLFQPHECYISYPSHPPWRDHSNYTYLEKSTSYAAPHRPIFSSPLPFYTSLIQIFSSASCSQTPQSTFLP